MRDSQPYIELSEFLGNPIDQVEWPEWPDVDTGQLLLDWLEGLDNQQVSYVFERLGVLDVAQPVDYSALPETVRFLAHKIETLSIDKALAILREALVEHAGDVNFPSSDYRLIERLVNSIPFNATDKRTEGTAIDDTEAEKFIIHSFWLAQVKLSAALIAFHSPYPEVRAIVEPIDDPTMPVETFRVYVIALSWTVVGSVINNFFIHRLPQIALSTSTVQLLLLPSGKLWERFFARNKTITVFGKIININPGKWTSKEMMLATIMYSCSNGTPYAIYNIVVMKLNVFYGLKWVSWVYQVMFTVSTQFLGFAFAFVMLKVCVYPKKSVWPTLLPAIALNKALMDPEKPANINGWKISQFSFFFVAFLGSFFYSWIPSYFLTAISTFNWPTWFAPNLIHLENVTGTVHGLGLNPLPTLDWNILETAGCLTLPFFTYANHYLGMMLAFATILGVYYSNSNWTAYFPINSNKLYDGKAAIYDIRNIIDDNHGFDNSKYRLYGPPYFSAANLVTYGAYFFMYPFAILYHFITEWNSTRQSFVDIWHTVAASFKSDLSFERNKFDRDAHCAMMKNYKEVPSLWFIVIFLVSVSFAVACVWFFPVETPLWGVFFTIVINFLFLVPITIIASVTGFSFGLNVLVELIVGYTIPNSGLALITLKAYGYNIDSQASNYITDQKLAHYCKIPPRAIFRGQIISTFVSVFVALFITNWQIDNIPDLCHGGQKDKLVCPGANTFFFASIQYGEIGPAKMFGGVYPILKWCFLWGAIGAVVLAWTKKKGPQHLTKYFQPIVILGGFLAYAPYNLLYYTGGFYLSFLFMYHIKWHYPLWWEKYNYILTGALSSGVAISSLMIFFVRFKGNDLDWWGNRLDSQGMEAMPNGPTWLKAEDAPDGYVGLRKENFP